MRQAILTIGTECYGTKRIPSGYITPIQRNVLNVEHKIKSRNVKAVCIFRKKVVTLKTLLA